jgi:hypothetical protein
MGRRLRGAALLGAPGGRLRAVAVSGAAAQAGTVATARCGAAGDKASATRTEAVVSPWGVPGAEAGT